MTALESLIEQQVRVSTIGVFSRTTDRIAEELAMEILRDPETKAQLVQTVRAAFARALEAFNAEASLEEQVRARGEEIAALRRQLDELKRHR